MRISNRAKTVELKFVSNMKRQYEFSVDSLHIVLDTLIIYHECSAKCSINRARWPASPVMSIGDNFYPTVVGESMYGDFHEALYHLQKKLIATRNPEEIHGGGLLKYCNLLCRGYRPAVLEEAKNMERYMCSRFFIDFSDIGQQQSKLENYMYEHFVGGANDPRNDQLRYEYLMILYQVVDESTVCLMGRERRLALTLIEDMAFQVYHAPYYPVPLPDYLPTNKKNSKKKEELPTDHISTFLSSGGDQSSSSCVSTFYSTPTSRSYISSSLYSAASSGPIIPQKPPTPWSVMKSMTALPTQQINFQTATNPCQQIHHHNHN